MFDLEKRVAKWRSSLAEDGNIASEAVDELESHLRDSLEDLSSRMKAEEAFETAIGLLGKPDEIAKEFAKDGPLKPIDKAAFIVLGLVLSISLLRSLQSGFGFYGETGSSRWALFFAPDFTGTHLAHFLGAVSVYYIFRYLAIGREETKFNGLFVSSFRILVPAVFPLMWMSVMVHTVEYGLHWIDAAFMSYHVLYIAAPLLVLKRNWSKKRHLAQMGVVFWAIVILAKNLERSPEMGITLAFFLLFIAALPWISARLNTREDKELIS